jgi:hypothetical protein
MKKCILLAVIAMLTAFALRSSAQKADDYPLSVHVSSSKVVWIGELSNSSDFAETQIEAIIDGKKMRLKGTLFGGKHVRGNRPIILRPGDYRAKVVKEDAYNQWEYSREYELLLPNGTTEKLIAAGESE